MIFRTTLVSALAALAQGASAQTAPAPPASDLGDIRMPPMTRYPNSRSAPVRVYPPENCREVEGTHQTLCLEVPLPPGAKVSLITQPDWLERPTANDLMRAYPRAALKAHVEGSASIFCKVLTTGRLAECKVTSETPQGYGFGDAAVGLADHMLMKPQTKNGVPQEGVARIPINFRMPG